MLRSGVTSLRGRERAIWFLAGLLLTGLVACGDDSEGAPDAGNEPVEDSGRPILDAGDDPAPDAAMTDAAMTDAAMTDAAMTDAATDSGSREPDASDPEPDAEVDGGFPLTLGGLTVTVAAEEHELDLFGVPGHRFWFDVTEEQMTALNNAGQGGGYPGEGDIYTPGGSSAFFADHLLVQDALTGDVADYGKVEIALVGESTFRLWDNSHIPNIRVDANEFDKDTRIGTFEHVRLNNSLVGSIFRESLAHSIYRALDYPALRSSHAFLGATVWGEETWVPMTLIEMYKRRFCRDNEELIGGSCENMWEFAGDLGGYGGGYPGGPFPGGGGGNYNVPSEWCQVSDCDNTRLSEVMEVLAGTERGEGFKEALDDYIAWDRFHEFQCLNWIMWAGDDPIHNSNNNLIIERDTDHKLVWAPYSVDITAGQDWYLDVPLTGGNALASGCQSDFECWADTIATCEDLIARFDELNPEEMVDDLVTTLSQLGMMRNGDEERAEVLREWYVWRQTVLADELEMYRYLPDSDGNCPGDLILCGDGGCGTVEDCDERVCPVGGVICESTSQCYNPQYDSCPTCTETSPYYCNIVGSCVADIQVCIDECGYQGGGQYLWCDALSACIPYFYECPYDGGDEDAGVDQGGFGGMGVGGIGGINID